MQWKNELNGLERNTLQHAGIHCNTVQHMLYSSRIEFWGSARCPKTYLHCNTLHHTAPHCSTRQHTATHCNILQHTAAHCSTLQHTLYSSRIEFQGSGRCSKTCAHCAHSTTLQHTATHCNNRVPRIWEVLKDVCTLQHTAPHCNTLQHTATHCNTPCTAPESSSKDPGDAQRLVYTESLQICTKGTKKNRWGLFCKHWTQWRDLFADNLFQSERIFLFNSLLFVNASRIEWRSHGNVFCAQRIKSSPRERERGRKKLI